MTGSDSGTWIRNDGFRLRPLEAPRFWPCSNCSWEDIPVVKPTVVLRYVPGLDGAAGTTQRTNRLPWSVAATQELTQL